VSGQGDLAIGAVADATGLAVTAIRYYDEIGIIEPSSRAASRRKLLDASVSFVVPRTPASHSTRSLVCWMIEAADGTNS